MAQRRINVTVVEISSPNVSSAVGRFDSMAFTTDDRLGSPTGSRFGEHRGPSRANLIPDADPYIAQLVDRLSRQMAAENIIRLHAQASPPLGDSVDFYGESRWDNGFIFPEGEASD